jgi:hypothetical protein
MVSSTWVETAMDDGSIVFSCSLFTLFTSRMQGKDILCGTTWMYSVGGYVCWLIVWNHLFKLGRVPDSVPSDRYSTYFVFKMFLQLAFNFTFLDMIRFFVWLHVDVFHLLTMMLIVGGLDTLVGLVIKNRKIQAAISIGVNVCTISQLPEDMRHQSARMMLIFYFSLFIAYKTSLNTREKWGIPWWVRRYLPERFMYSFMGIPMIVSFIVYGIEMKT